jgi:uncharacterized protein YxjI
MNLSIKERKLSLRSTYDIVTDSAAYTAVRKLLAIFPSIQVVDSGNQPALTLKGGFALFSQKYTMVFPDGRTFNYKTEKRIKAVYLAEGGGEQYRLYRHRGVTFSVFKGDTQIAAVSKNRMVIGAGNEYAVQMNSDADPLIIAGMILAFNTSVEDEKKGIAKIDIGYMGLEDRARDVNWQPS